MANVLVVRHPEGGTA